MFDHYMNGLKAVPFKEFGFSATCKALIDTARYGTAEPVPFFQSISRSL